MLNYNYTVWTLNCGLEDWTRYCDQCFESALSLTVFTEDPPCSAPLGLRLGLGGWVLTLFHTLSDRNTINRRLWGLTNQRPVLRSRDQCWPVRGPVIMLPHTRQLIHKHFSPAPHMWSVSESASGEHFMLQWSDQWCAVSVMESPRGRDNKGISKLAVIQLIL